MSPRDLPVIVLVLLTTLSVATAGVQTASSLGLETFPEGLPAGFDFRFTGSSGTAGVANDGVTGTVLCAKQPSGVLYDWITSITLTTDTAPSNRLVGISFKCNLGSTGSVYSGGRKGPVAGDTTSTAAGTYFGGGFNGAAITTGLYGESSYQDGGNIISGLSFSSIQECGSSTDPKSPAAVTSSVTGGSGDLINTLNYVNTKTVCLGGDKFVGFSYATGGYFNGLQLLYYAF